MKTFVLCGGEGTRLRPHTYRVPKPMLRIADKPILQYVIENLKQNGLDDLVLTVGYKREQIMDYFGNGEKFGVRIEYLVEKTPQNTAGSILPYKDRLRSLREPFVVVMGDHVSTVPLRKMIDSHRQNPAVATIALLPHATRIEFGVVRLQDHAVAEFAEKPVVEHLISIGMYVFDPAIFDHIHEKEDFAKQVFPRLLERGQRINGYVTEGRWDDVGRIADFDRLNEEMANASGSHRISQRRKPEGAPVASP